MTHILGYDKVYLQKGLLLVKQAILFCTNAIFALCISVAFYNTNAKEGLDGMIVEKVINNNLIRSFSQSGQEILVMGCGLGFKKDVGDVIDESKIEKVYVMNNSEEHHQLEEILARVPLECMKVTNEIVDYAKTVLGHELSDRVYLTLCDHISFALERNREGIQIRNALLGEIKQFYHSEYAASEEALKIIHEHFQVELPQDEIGFIALHLVNANLNAGGLAQTTEMMKVIQSIIHIIKYHYNIELRENTIHYDRFITHLKFFTQRVFSGKSLDESDESFFLMIKTQYKKAYACVLKIADFMQKEYNIQLTNDEMMYLAVHIHRITTM